jgi:hypothetical protein
MIGEEWMDLSFDSSGKLTHFHSPRASKAFFNGGQPNFTTTVTDSLQGSTSTVTTDFAGDLVSSLLDGEIGLAASTTDTSSGSQTTLNQNLSITSNRFGAAIAKTYSGGISETYSLNGDGSPAGYSVSGAGGGLSASITQIPTQATTNYSDGRNVVEKFYESGPRSEVSTPGDKRTFKYERFQLTEESHVDGPWSGWKVERVPDLRDGSERSALARMERFDAHSAAPTTTIPS